MIFSGSLGSDDKDVLRNLDTVTLGVRILGDLGPLSRLGGHRMRLVSLTLFVLTQKTAPRKHWADRAVPVGSHMGAQPGRLWNLRVGVGLELFWLFWWSPLATWLMSLSLRVGFFDLRRSVSRVVTCSEGRLCQQSLSPLGVQTAER